MTFDLPKFASFCRTEGFGRSKVNIGRSKVNIGRSKVTTPPYSRMNLFSLKTCAPVKATP